MNRIVICEYLSIGVSCIIGTTLTCGNTIEYLPQMFHSLCLNVFSPLLPLGAGIPILQKLMLDKCKCLKKTM